MRDDPQHPAAPAMRADSAPAVPATVWPTECAAGAVELPDDTPRQPLSDVVICVGKSGDPFRDHDALLNEHDPTKHMNNIAHPSHRFLPLRFKTRSTVAIASSNRAMVRSIDWRAAEARPSSSSTVSGGSSRYRSTAFRTS